MSRTLILTIVICCFLSLTAGNVGAVQLTSSGTFVDETSNEAGTWKGQFRVEVSNLSGSVTLAEPGYPTTSLPVQGSFTSQRVAFGSLGANGVPAQFNASSDGTGVHGTFVVGSRHGTFSGQWGPAVDDGRPAAPAGEPDGRTLAIFDNQAPPIGVDPANPRASACAILNDLRVRTLITPAGARAATDICNGTVAAAMRTVDPLLAWALFRNPFDFLVLAASPDTASAATPVNVRANDPSTDTYPVITQSEVSLAVSVANPNTILAAYNDDSELAIDNSRMGYSTSTDSGASWTDRGPIPPPPNGENDGDPAAAADPFGIFHVGELAATQQSAFIGVSESTDQGATFDTPVNASPLAVSPDKDGLAIDGFAQSSPYAGYVYVCYTEFVNLPGIHFTVSTNGGASYRDVGNPISSGQYSVQGCAAATAPNGNVYVAWWDGGSENALPPNTIRVVRSANGGTSFSQEVAIGSTGSASPPTKTCGDPQSPNPVLTGNVRSMPYPSIATDPLVPDNVYVTWSTYQGGSSEIMFSRSTDDGTTWSPAVRLNDTTTNDQFMPQIATSVLYAANPNVTEVKVMWYDRRLDSQNLNVDLFADTSTSSGSRWGTDVQWDTAQSKLPQLLPNFDTEVASCYFGDYNGISSLNPAGSSNFILGWGDTRDKSSQNTPDPNVYTAAGC